MNKRLVDFLNQMYEEYPDEIEQVIDEEIKKDYLKSSNQAPDKIQIISENESKEKKCSHNYSDYMFCPFVRITNCAGCPYFK